MRSSIPFAVLAVMLAARCIVAQEPTSSSSPLPAGAQSSANASAGSKPGRAGTPGSGDANQNPVPIGKDVIPPRVLHDPDPEYSDVARKAGYQGMVGLSYVVGTDGHLTDIRVTRSIGMGLDEAAVAAVRKWRFEPATRSGVPVPARIVTEVGFRLDGSAARIPLLNSPSGAANGSGTAPEFPGVDRGKYPLVLRIGDLSGVPHGSSVEVIAKAEILEQAGKRALSISCTGNKGCATLGPGLYPASWISGADKLDLVGKDLLGKLYKAEYKLQ